MTNDHAGLLTILDAAGRTIDGLEQRVDHLTAQVAALTRDRDGLAHLLAEARATMCDARDLPPDGETVGQDETHEQPTAAPGADSPPPPHTPV